MSLLVSTPFRRRLEDTYVTSRVPRPLRSLFSTVIFALAIAFIAQPAAAQGAQTAEPAAVPRVITVTGVFQPVDGQPPRAVETITLALYAEATGGAPLWQETQSVAVDVKGRYALLLGATSADGIPAAVLAAGAQWLGTKFDRPGEVESARAQLTSVPYTLRAADADTLGGRPASAYLLAPTAGSAESRAMKPASESRAATSTSTTPNAVLPGTDGFVAKYVGTADVGPSAIYEAAGTGNVGIGATNPLDALHVRFTNPGGTATGYAVQNLSGAANAYSGMLFYDQNGVLGQFQGFNNTTHEYRINNIANNGSINFMLAGTSRFEVASSGNVGIGTTTPVSPLEVSNALSFTGSTGDINATSFSPLGTAPGSAFLGRKARGTSAAPTALLAGDQLAFFGGKGYGATAFGPSLQGTGGMSVNATQNWSDASQPTSLAFSTTPSGSAFPTVRMTLDPFGNLGLGTATPQANIELSATAPAVIMTTSYGNGPGGSIFNGRKARGTPAAPSAVQVNDILASFSGRGYGATGFNFTGGLGGVAVVAAENWTDTAQGTSLGFTTTATGTTTPANKMTITASGNLGVGTPTPSFPLEVSRTAQPAAVTPQDSIIASTVYTNGTSASSFFIAQTARGTAAAPAAVQLGDFLGGFGMSGFGATSFNDVFAAIAAGAAENFTDTARGTALILGTTPLGTKDLQIGMSLLPSGNVGIGTPMDGNGLPTATDKLQIFGDARVGDAGTNGCLKRFDGNFLVGTCVSDRRFKKNITPFGRVLDQLSALQPVNYYWRAAEYPERHFGDTQAYGLIAQDVEQILPELVVTSDDGYKAVDYTKLPLLTIEAVKELKAENDALKQRVAELDPLKQRVAELDPLKQRVAELERLLTELLAAQR